MYPMNHESGKGYYCFADEVDLPDEETAPETSNEEDEEEEDEDSEDEDEEDEELI